VIDTQTEAAVSAIPSSSAAVECVACTRHQCRSRSPYRAAARRAAARVRDTGLDLFHLLSHVDVQRQIGGHVAQRPGRLLEHRQRNRAQTVERGAGAMQPGVSPGLLAQSRLDGPQELIGFQSEAQLLALERGRPEIAGLIERRQERQGDAGLIGRRRDGVPQGIGARIGLPSRRRWM